MNFFTEIAKHLAGFDLKVSLTKKGDEITVGIFPDHKNADVAGKMGPLLIKGTADELDQGFFDKINPPLETATGLVANIDNYNTELKKLEQDAKEKVEKKKSEPAKKTSAPAKKKPAPKKAAPNLPAAKPLVKTKPRPVKAQAKKRTPAAAAVKPVEVTPPQAPVQPAAPVTQTQEPAAPAEQQPIF